MSQEYPTPDAEEEYYIPPQFSAFTQAKILGGAFASSALIDLAAHGGVAGLILAGGASYAILKASPVFYPVLQDIRAAWERAVEDRRAKHLEQQGEIEAYEDAAPEQFMPEAPRMPDAPVETDVLDETVVEAQTLIPHAPAFKDMCHLITGERMPLCYVVVNGQSVPLYGTLEDILSMAIVGIPGQGKTTALMYYVSILLKYGAEVVVWDPHGVMTELSELNGAVLPNMPATAKLTYLDRKQDIFDSVEPLNAELDRRDEEYRACQRRRVKYQKHPIVLLADELPVLANYEVQMQKKVELANKRLARDEDPEVPPSLIDLMQRFVLEARKWFGVFIGSGQSTDAKVLPTRVTECLSSRIVFFSSNRRASMAGLEQEDIKRFMPILKRLEDSRGIMIFDAIRFKETMLGTIPSITVGDMKEFLMGSTAQVYEQPKQARSFTSPMQNNVNELSVMLHSLKAGKITYEEMLQLIDQLPVITTDPDEEEEAPRRSTMPAQKLVLPGAQPASHVAPTTRLAQREQTAHLPWTQHVPSGARPYLRAVPTEMEDLPVVQEEQLASGHFTSALSPELQRALDTYQPGMSYRELADAMTERYHVKVNKDKAGMFIKMLKERRLIAG